MKQLDKVEIPDNYEDINQVHSVNERPSRPLFAVEIVQNDELDFYIKMDCYDEGRVRFTEHGWNNLVAHVSMTIDAEKRRMEEERTAVKASPEMRQALSDLPTNTIDKLRDRDWKCGRVEEDVCTNCGQYPSEGHDGNCMAGPP